MSLLFWNTSSARYEDIPTLGLLLRLVDPDLLLREIVDVATAPPRIFGGAAKGDDRELRASYADALKRMRAIEPVSSVDAGEQIVLFPRYTYMSNPDRGVVMPHVDAAAIRVDDFAAACEALRAECPAGSGGVGSPGRAVGEAFHWAPWQEVLGYRVWLAGDFSRRERYRALADVVRFMTFLGMDPGKHDEAAEADQSEIDEAYDEVFGDLELHWTEYPSTHFCRPDAASLGLEASTDDYDAEYEARFDEQVRVLMDRADRDLADRIEHLSRVLKG